MEQKKDHKIFVLPKGFLNQETKRKLHINLFLQGTIEKGSYNIELVDLKVNLNSQCKEGTDGGKLDHTKDL